MEKKENLIQYDNNNLTNQVLMPSILLNKKQRPLSEMNKARPIVMIKDKLQNIVGNQRPGTVKQEQTMQQNKIQNEISQKTETQFNMKTQFKLQNIKDQKLKPLPSKTSISNTNPNQSMHQSSKNVNSKIIEQLIQNKSNLTHAQKMKEFRKRMGIPENQMIFCIDSQDDYIRRCLNKNGWHENQNFQSTLFDLKWVVTDQDHDYKWLQKNQIFNHFQNNKSITSKSGLNNCLRYISEFGSSIDSFYPRCYDLGNDNQVNEFIEDFEFTQMQVLLKKYQRFFKIKRKNVVSECKKAQDQKCKSNKKKNQQKLYQKYFEEQKDNTFLINMPLTEISLSFYKSIIRQSHQCVHEKEYQTVNQIKFKKMVLEYSTIDLENNNHDFGGPSCWQTPNTKLIEKINKYHQKFKKLFPQYKVDGIKNIWLIKPSGNARGQGIHLVDSLDECIESGQQNQARLVQKYIESSCLLNNSPLKGKKFDIRQWVLVTSFNPLKIYFFDSCYLRICSQDYDLNDINNNFRHLTNYSLNKTGFQNQEDSIMSLEIFKRILSNHHQNIDWDKIIKPKIQNIVIKTLKSSEDLITHKQGCFELYGFDILLDKNFEPWLLEVNLSPACNERVQWLTNMLDEMAEGLLNLVLPANKINLQQEGNHKFELIYEDPELTPDLLQTNFNNATDKLEIVGKAVNKKKEEKLDKRYFQYHAAIKIQQNIRMFLCQLKLKRLKKLNRAIIIQKFVRMTQAIKKLKFLKETKFAIIIQKNVRMIQSIQKLINLKKQKLALKLQSLFRMKKAIQLKKNLKFLRDVTQIQCFFRVMLSLKKFKQRKYYTEKLIFLQKYFKLKHQQKLIKCIQLQSYMRMVYQRQRYRNQLYEYKCTVLIQKNYKRHLAQLQLKHLKLIKATIYLQSLIRKNIAIKKLNQLKKKKACLIFQQVLTKKLLYLSLSQIKHISVIRNKNALIIQSMKKIIKAKKLKRRLLAKKKIINLQSIIRMLLVRPKVSKMKKIRNVNVIKFIKNISHQNWHNYLIIKCRQIFFQEYQGQITIKFCFPANLVKYIQFYYYFIILLRLYKNIQYILQFLV